VIILDTNVLSNLMREIPDPRVLDWLDQQPRASIWTTSVTVFEVRFGVQILEHSRRRTALGQAFEQVLARIGHRIAGFDAAAADHASDLMAARHKKGRPGEFRDTMIAGIVIAQHATLATRNIEHFEDAAIPLINPWVL
jgi:predicted nucleic acid-binding protein